MWSNWSQYQQQCWRVALAGCLGLAIATTPARANSPPPPAELWFRFADTTPSAVQVASCSTAACENPKLLWEFGNCTSTGCLPPNPDTYTLRCHNQRCLAINPPLDSERDILELRVQQGDRLYRSNNFTDEGIFEYGSRTHWQVTLANQQATLSPDDRPFPLWRNRLFTISFLITLPIELGVAALLLQRQAPPRPTLRRSLGSLTLANLFSFPVVWAFFTSLEPLWTDAGRAFGSCLLAIALLNLAALWPVRRKNLWLIASVSLGLGFAALIPTVLLIFLATYSYNPPHVSGWPYAVTMTLAELFAILYEALALKLLSRSQLSWWQAGRLSLFANLASALLGWLLLPLAARWSWPV